MPAARVPVFVPTGKVARTILSCDDGRTWIRDRSDNNATNCSTTDCDHHSGSAREIIFGSDWFFASYGWGSPGTVRHSRDGANWETVATTTSGGGGLALFTNNLLWVAHNQFQNSLNLGLNFTNINSAVGYLLSRKVTSAGSVVIVTGDQTDTAKISRDSGTTWSNFNIPNTDLSGRNLNIRLGNGVLVGLTSKFEYNATTGTGMNSAFVVRSTDNGQTWSGQRVKTGLSYALWSTLHFDGTQFITWFEREMWTSVNGITWNRAAATLPAEIQLGAVARSTSGTFVSIVHSYNQQMALRSADGLSRTRLSAGQFTQSHPIIDITSGLVDADVCRY